MVCPVSHRRELKVTRVPREDKENLEIKELTDHRDLQEMTASQDPLENREYKESPETMVPTELMEIRETPENLVMTVKTVETVLPVLPGPKEPLVRAESMKLRDLQANLEKLVPLVNQAQLAIRERLVPKVKLATLVPMDQMVYPEFPELKRELKVNVEDKVHPMDKKENQVLKGLAEVLVILVPTVPMEKMVHQANLVFLEMLSREKKDRKEI